jgi:mono/diheme cytochrome c family protein
MSIGRRDQPVTTSLLLAAATWLAVIGTAAAGLAQEVNFGRDIRPILAKRCYTCHGPDASEGGLQLHQEELALAELDSGEHAIVAGNLDDSVLLARITAEDEFERMPPEGRPLEPDQIELIRKWIDQGAKWEQYWAFVPPEDAPVPQVRNAQWVRNPIDAFILHGLEQNGLAPAPPADKTTLIRRLYYGLTGLPPTPEDVDRFVNDSRPLAYDDLVDRLLESPHYGERWARHWLDLVRFAETNSFERDGVKPNAWKYRDYVIRSFNDDKPYDRFILEQLAGDELDDVTTDSLTATGYYRLGIWDDEPADPLQAHYDEMDNILATTGQVFLGLTFNCARCHDHKIDPIPQTDYYGLLAFMADVTSYGTRGDQVSANQLDVSPPEVSAEYVRLDRQDRQLARRLRQLEQAGIAKMTAEDQRKTEGPQRQAVLNKKLQQFLDDAQWMQYETIRASIAEAKAQREKLPPREVVLGLGRTNPRPPTTHVLFRGNPHVQGDTVEPHFPTLFGGEAPSLPTVSSDARSAGRRRMLAAWIASPQNMLTARVMVNRVWQFHFGRGIVRSTNNFGQLGTPPTHPELLDWLAHRFIEGGWRLKPLHKLILTSNAFRMSSQAHPDGLLRDPDNDRFWRFDMRRLSAEEVRDAIMMVNGALNPEMFGPSVYPRISQEVLHSQSRPGSGWGRSSAEQQNRRSIYIHVKRSLITPLLTVFDFPETDVSCEARFITTQPSQALAMLNGEFLNEEAGRLAKRLKAEAGEQPEDQVRMAIRLALARDAQQVEVDAGMQLIGRLQERHQLDRDEALRFYCLTVLNLTEFVYLD